MYPYSVNQLHPSERTLVPIFQAFGASWIVVTNGPPNIKPIGFNAATCKPTDFLENNSPVSLLMVAVFIAWLTSLGDSVLVDNSSWTKGCPWSNPSITYWCNFSKSFLFFSLIYLILGSFVRLFSVRKFLTVL